MSFHARLILLLAVLLIPVAACERAAERVADAPRPGHSTGRNTPVDRIPPAKTAVEVPPDEPPAPPPTGDGTLVAPATADRLLPLSAVLEIVRARAPGDVLDVELDEDDDDPPTYEISVLTADGRVLEASIDARTGAVIQLEED